MNNIEKYVANNPSQSEIAQIRSAIAESDQLAQEIIIGADAIKETNDKIQALIQTANSQKENKVGFFSGKKTAIESLQSLADFQADTISDLWNYQKLTFQQLTQLAETSNKLIVLGVANAAVTRAVIDQLKSKTKAPLSEDARRHLFSVIKDLERQADAQDRISRLRENVEKLADVTANSIQNESNERKIEFSGLKKAIEYLESTSTTSEALAHEIEIREDNFKQLIVAIENLSNTAATSEALSNEVRLRKNDIKQVMSAIEDVRITISSSNASILKQIEESNNSHSTKFDLVNEEISCLKTKNKHTLYIGIFALVLAICSIIANVFL